MGDRHAAPGFSRFRRHPERRERDMRRRLRAAAKPGPSRARLIGLGVLVFVGVVVGGLAGPSALAWFREAASRPAPVFYAWCSDAHERGVYSIRRDEPGYRDELDADGDGLACEPYLDAPR